MLPERPRSADIDRVSDGARDEEARLRVLARFPDWQNQTFDDIVRLAALICKTPLADIAIVGADEVWLKTGVGWQAQSHIERRHSFARFVMDRIDLVVINDALADPDFRESPHVTGEPHIRFAAGVPILVEGFAIGTLCVFDRVPRDLADEAALALRALARQCVSQLELRRSLRIEREAEERLALIFESATDYAIISLDPGGAIRTWNTGARLIFGWSEQEMVGLHLSSLFLSIDRDVGAPERDLAKAAEHGREINERYYQRRDRSSFWGTGETMPLRTTAGETRGFLKILRDRTAQKRVSEALATQTGILQAITDHIAEALIQVDVDNRVTFLNPAAEEMFGWSRYELIGVNLHDRLHHRRADGSVFPREACPYVVALQSRATLLRRPDVFIHRDGRAIDVIVSFAPIVNEGCVTGGVFSLSDVTEAIRIEENLRRTQERYQLAVTSSDIVGSWDWDLRTGKIVADATLAEQYGVDPEAAARGVPLEAFQAAIHPEDRQRVFKEIDVTIARGVAYAGEFRVLRPDASVRWVAAHASCHYDDGGRPLRFPGLSIDITDRKRAEDRRAALLGLEDVLRNQEDTALIVEAACEILCRLLDARRAGFCQLDATGEYGIIERDHVRDGMKSLVGTFRVADFGSHAEEIRQGTLVAIDDVAAEPRMREAQHRWIGLRIGAVVNAPLMAEGRLAAVIFVHDDRAHVWTEEDLDLIRTVADRTWAALSRALSAVRQQILTDELHHRIKNTMAMVLAIANQTMRKSATKEEGFVAFESRILALSDAQDILTRSSWSSAPMIDLIEGALAPHWPEEGERVSIDGPDIELSAQTALSFALAIHELATNATKYGAFSNDTGHVAIAWSFHEEDGRPFMLFDWKERGGPPVTAPTHKGFGSRLIKGSFPKTIRIAMDYEPDGLRCSFLAPSSAL